MQISADTTNDLVVRTRPGLTLRDAGTGENTVLPDNGATRGGSRSTDRAVTVAFFTAAASLPLPLG